MIGDENHDKWLELSLSMPEPQPQQQPQPQPQPETQPSYSVPIQLSTQPHHQGMTFPVSQYSMAPPQFFFTPLPVPYHQYNHNYRDQPSSSHQVQVQVPEVGLQQNQYQAVNPVIMWQFDLNATTPLYSQPRPPPPAVAMPEVIPETALATFRDTERHEAGPSRQPRASRRLPLQPLAEGKSLDIDPPYRWATSRRAHIYSLDELLSQGINSINGEVQCKYCQRMYRVEFDLQSKFSEVAEYIRRNKCDMHQRAPNVWMNPVLPGCQYRRCGKENCARPVIDKKKTTNWLFLLLGQMLGCCKLEHLKYFCKHTRNHRTGAKDRVLYLTYMDLCKQLDPKGPFDA